ncbi:MAG: 50S ribosomal protein L10 [Dissulfurimicrobium sp.]|uniref:50S ribosomal protein L10 n=1 Tax=Dissulfurimicrobium TaxID=1769732 RepID=UPI001EDB5C16|nr:50S ribosomal protein L10 [Dissulfurimicrobium hydrothermale]UKL14462.1 50S ribosomal protein L10 [Dissulfurimicrobium hydrothermale]
MKRKQKEAMLESMHGKFARSTALVMVDYSGLKVSDSDSLRKTLREIDAEFRVSKNTIYKKAVEGTQAEVIKDLFEGPKAVAISYGDPVAMAKVLVNFTKANEALQIKGGVLSGKLIDAAGVAALSAMPSREFLLAQLLSALVATPTAFVNVLAGVPRKLLYALKAIAEKKA